MVLDAAAAGRRRRRYFAAVAERLDVVVADVTQPDDLAAGARRARHHSYRSRRHGNAAIARHGRRGQARTGSGKSRPHHRRQRHGNGGHARLGAHAADTCRDSFTSAPARSTSITVRTVPANRLPEDGYVMPRRLYGISKLASELITERYGDLFGLSTASVRPVVGLRNHGPGHGEPQFPSRAEPHRPYGRSTACSACASTRSMRSGDYIHVEDVAGAIVSLLARAGACATVPTTSRPARPRRIGDLVGWAAEKVPGFHARDHRAR